MTLLAPARGAPVADVARLKDQARQSIEAHRGALIELSHRIHSTPELAFEEVEASQWIAEALAEAGFNVTKPAYELDTAFVARAGTGPLHLAICAEYDALPSIGHACGHNIIASAAVGAGIGLVRLADDAGLTISVIGTPAEERGGGKILLLDRGAFDSVDAAMMVHPAPCDVAMPMMLAGGEFTVQYTGKESHAGAAPQLGINAADALVVAQTAIGLLRQQIDPTDRIHGIVTKGGDAPNIIPAHTSARYVVRANKIDELQALRDRVLHCFEAGALATGARLQVDSGSSAYAQVEHDSALAAIYRRNAEALGRSFIDLDVPLGSTDMGNVSLAVPSIHPYVGVESWPAVNHQPEFAACCVAPAADKAAIDAGIAMAWTALDIAGDDVQRARLVNKGVRP